VQKWYQEMWKGICSDLLERVLEEYDLLERKK
jgi:hypothetical protein